jgi:hypothetical protein
MIVISNTDYIENRSNDIGAIENRLDYFTRTSIDTSMRIAVSTRLSLLFVSYTCVYVFSIDLSLSMNMLIILNSSTRNNDIIYMHITLLYGKKRNVISCSIHAEYSVIPDR